MHKGTLNIEEVMGGRGIKHKLCRFKQSSSVICCYKHELGLHTHLNALLTCIGQRSAMYSDSLLTHHLKAIAALGMTVGCTYYPLPDTPFPINPIKHKCLCETSGLL